ncbi:hypothetical protein PUNSTDRAFT_132789 [Punctularia strigosozonata HHB-11173 SS5]|uniref:uncharacterized protein n=1 Tax=Punctularia strigosozonata (strain HHB-11173) TaxID=741275 RepID=UPI00044166E3|nr:uncharacterized protein PUNSTDRAFT_132789 [Punctularia strigosozonata HHB-11173 SS5]EIN10714.1 hypothetical protein PUNSTDRAFT_132789 [Punctularia strigosozonata HHB-11173 SS5]
MSLIARNALRQSALRSRVLTQSRAFHGPYTPEHAVPFSFKSKSAFATKTASYLIVGFSIPFIAAVYQLRKSAGAAA